MQPLSLQNNINIAGQHLANGVALVRVENCVLLFVVSKVEREDFVGGVGPAFDENQRPAGKGGGSGVSQQPQEIQSER